MALALDDQDLADRLDAFAAAYSAMSRFLLAPADAELLSMLAEPSLLAGWPLASGPDSRRGLGFLAAAIRTRESDEALASDYYRLFVGPGPVPAPPYESVHLTEERLLFDTSTFEVRAAYRAFGMQAPLLNREPDDHLGLEFSFLALVCAAALDARRDGDRPALGAAIDAHRRFLGNHLLRWAPDCLSAVESNASTAFYRGIGALGLGVTSEATVWCQ